MAVISSVPYPSSRPLSAAGLEAAKLAALALMTVNHAFLGLADPWAHLAFLTGRPCVALFSTIMVLRLAEGDDARTVRALGRLFVWGAVAQPVYWLLSRNLGLRLDILFSLAAGVGLIWLLQTRRPILALLAAAALAPAAPWLDGGALTPLAMAGGWLLLRRRPDRPWPAIALIVAASVAHNLIATPDFWPGAVAVLAAPAILVVAARLPLGVRLPGWVFYAYYPAHLAAIWLVFGAYR
jgi:hypothetical protein